MWYKLDMAQTSCAQEEKLKRQKLAEEHAERLASQKAFAAAGGAGADVGAGTQPATPAKATQKA
jgi:hypothetical protein